MKSLVAFYSRTSTTKKLAEDIAAKANADIEEIKPKVNYQGKLGYARGIKDGAAGKNVELETLKSAEDKALIMGFILSRLSAVIRQKHRENDKYRHITLVEEAHRLLSKVEYGDSGSKKGAVETFTDLLAEVRKYGEGLIIVDQIPNKLAPEVML